MVCLRSLIGSAAGFRPVALGFSSWDQLFLTMFCASFGLQVCAQNHSKALTFGFWCVYRYRELDRTVMRCIDILQKTILMSEHSQFGLNINNIAVRYFYRQNCMYLMPICSAGHMLYLPVSVQFYLPQESGRWLIHTLYLQYIT